MKGKIFFVVSFLLFFLIFFPQLSISADFKFAQDYSLKRGDVIDGDFYFGGGNLTLSGSVSGDLFAFGVFNVFSNENVGKDALLIGRTVNSLADTNGNLRIVAGNALVGGNINGDFVSAIADLKIHPETLIEKNVYIIARKAIVDGVVSGSTLISGGEIFLNGTFKGPVEINANEVSISSGAVLEQGLSYTSPFPASVEEGAVINGEVVFKESSMTPKSERYIPTFWGVWFLVKVVILLVGALVLHGIFRRISDRFVSEGSQNYLTSFLWGFLFVLAIPVSLALITLTFVGIPFVLLGISIFVFMLVLAFFYSPILIGSVAKKIIFKEKSLVVTWKTIILGIAILTVLSYLPYVGALARGVIFLTVLGAILKVLIHKFSEVR